MIMQQGTTNGFRFGESLIGASLPAKRFAVVSLGGEVHYAVVTNGGAKRLAKRRKAFGYWRLKKKEA